MNGKKARGLRNEATHFAKSMDTDYVDTKHPVFSLSGKQEVTTKLVAGCHRAIYQELKTA